MSRRKEVYSGIDIPPCPSPLVPINQPDLPTMRMPGDYALPSVRSDVSGKLAMLAGSSPDLIRFTTRIPGHVKSDIAVDLNLLARDRKSSPAGLATDLASRYSATEGSYTVLPISSFLNVSLSREVLALKVLGDIERQGTTYGTQNIGQGRAVVLEYFSPMVGQRLDLMNLRSALVGDSLARIYRAGGYKVIADSSPNEWSTRFGMLACAYEVWGDGIPEFKQDKASSKGLHKLYDNIDWDVDREGKARMIPGLSKIFPHLEKIGKTWLDRLETGDPEARRLLNWARDISDKDFRRFCRALGIDFNYQLGESFYSGMTPEIIARMQQSGFVNSRRNEYIARDLAALVARDAWFDPVKIAYLSGRDQQEYFEQVFKAYDDITLGERPRTEFLVLGNTSVNGERKEDLVGDTTKAPLGPLLSGSIEGFDIVKQRDTVQEARFYYLKQRRDRGVEIDPKTIKTEMQSVAYMRYAIRSANSFREYAAGLGFSIDSQIAPVVTSNTEHDLIMELAKYPEAVSAALEENQPSRVATSILRVTEAFGLYCRYDITGREGVSINTQLRLARATATVLENGLGLLGISVINKL